MASFNFLKKVVPWIGAAATGNVPALIAMAAKTVGDVIGTEVKPDLDAITAAVEGATPEQILALKAEDNRFAEKMQALGFEHEEDIEKIAAEDRANARGREMAVRDKIPAVLAIGITVGFFTLLFWIVGHGVVSESKDVINIMMGSLGTAWIAVVTYYFGSSAGSARKDEIRIQENAK